MLCLTVLLHPHTRPLFHPVKLGDDDLVPVVERAAVHENEVIRDGKRAPSVLRGVLVFHADPLVPGADVDTADLGVIVLRRVFLDGEQIHVDPLCVENFSEKPEGGRGDIDVILLVGVFRALLVEEGLGFGEQSLPRDRQNLRVV